MGWEKGKYYTRSKRVGGRVVREYVGSGAVAVHAARMDAVEREQRRAEAAAWRAERERLGKIDEQVAMFCRVADLFARAALVAAGFHRHDRGQWRKRRDSRNE